MTRPRKPEPPQPTCLRCRGVGSIPNPDHSKEGFVTCPDCGGSGKQ